MCPGVRSHAGNRSSERHVPRCLGCRCIGRHDSEKLSKVYSVSCDVELLLYTNGRTVLPDDTIQAMLEPIFQEGIGQYKRVWFFGDDLHVLAQRGG